MTHDPTESIRREMVQEINVVEGSREYLEQKYGLVWDTSEVQRDFRISGFLAPFVRCTRKSDGKDGLLMFQHNPRFYFDFQES